MVIENLSARHGDMVMIPVVKNNTDHIVLLWCYLMKAASLAPLMF